MVNAAGLPDGIRALAGVMAPLPALTDDVTV
jgi:hypothetical protein